MRRFLVGAMVCFAAALAVWAADHPVTFFSADDSDGAHGVYRWDVKIDMEAPPDVIPDDHKVKPSTIGDWAAPKGKITGKTPRSGREKEWWEVTGKVVLMKAEDDGDLHIQLCDADNADSVQVVVEVPVRQFAAESPWTEIRTEAFTWTDVNFPLTFSGSKMFTLNKKPVIKVEGKAFFDATHRKKDMPNRRNNTDKEIAVWEIHPVMRLEVVQP
jgi:hypothetical protein